MKFKHSVAVVIHRNKGNAKLNILPKRENCSEKKQKKKEELDLMGSPSSGIVVVYRELKSQLICQGNT